MHAVKTVRFEYWASEELQQLFEDFRLMCNDAIRTAIEVKAKSRFELIREAYPRLGDYGLHSHYILSACEVAYSVYCNKNRKSNPYIRKAFLKLDNQSYVLNHLLLRIPTTPRHYVYCTLKASNYHFSFINDRTLKMGSITLSSDRLGITFSKEVAEIEPLGNIGVDINERNVTISATDNVTNVYDTSDVAELKEKYKAIRSEISRRTQKDRRIQKRLLTKYGRRERARTVQALHRLSKTTVQHARKSRFGITLEKLKGIRKLYHKGNGQGSALRGRMNSWSFHEIQKQIVYKSLWAGIPVSFVNARGTSRKCPECGSLVAPLKERRLYCQVCDKLWDRDVLASKNILACAVPQARPPKGSREEVGVEDPIPSSRLVEVESIGMSHGLDGTKESYGLRTFEPEIVKPDR